MEGPEAGGCSLPGTVWNSLLKAGAQVALPEAPSPLTHSSGLGSDTLSSFPWGLPGASEALHPEEKPLGLLPEWRGLGAVCPSGVWAHSGRFLPTPWCSAGSWGFEEPGLKTTYIWPCELGETPLSL